MTTPNVDPGLLVEQALADLKTAILQFFESNPIDEAHHQVADKDALHTQVLARIQQQSDVSAQAADAYAEFGANARKPASPRAAGSAHAQASPASTSRAGTMHVHPSAIASANGQDDPALSGAHWSTLFPSLGTDIKHLDDDFGPRVARFIAAMRNAGIEVVVVSARRSPERAYLMHWSYKIFKEGSSAKEADLDKSRPAGVGIRWQHTDEHGVYDPEASARAAGALYHALGIANKLGVEPALKSNHIAGLAVDMTTTWRKDSITIRMADDTEVVINTTSDSERTDNNPELHEVAESYGVIHFASQKGAKSLSAGDKNHWSYDGR